MARQYNPDSISSKILRNTVGLIMKTVMRPKVYFTDKSIQGKGSLPHPCIIVSNHKNHVDGTLLGTIFPKERIHYLAAKDRFEQNALMRWYLTKTRCIPIDRKTADISWVHQSLQYLKENKEPVCIYPEGLRSFDSTILPFHNGVAMLANLANVPIVMVYTDGPYKLFRGPRILIDTPFMLDIPDKKRLNSETISNESLLLHEHMVELQAKLKAMLDEQKKRAAQ